MRIEVDKLGKHAESFAHNYAPGELSLEDESKRLTVEPTVNGEARKEGRDVRIRGSLTAEAEARCDRCLRALTIPVESDFDARFVPSEVLNDGAEDAELKPDELEFDFYEGDSIEIDALVRDEILLALPMRLLCSEDCKGLCPECGADLNEESCACEKKAVDPRWAGLAALKKSE